jgi:hypothetical protein
MPRTDRFSPREEDPVHTVQENGWAPGPVQAGAEILTPPVLDPQTVKPVASRYTSWAIPTIFYPYSPTQNALHSATNIGTFTLPILV